jgi:hypothetical protein
MMRARARDQRLVAGVNRVPLLWHACIESFRYREDSMCLHRFAIIQRPAD